MKNTPNCPDGIRRARAKRKHEYVLLFLLALVFIIQSCKLDPPLIPDSLTHPTPTDTIPATPTDTIPTTPPIGTTDTVITDTITPATARFNQLKAWNAFKASANDRYDLLLIGDSYTQGNFYSWRLRGKLLIDGFNDGGPGYDSFGRWDPMFMFSIDASMDLQELTFDYDPLLWNTSPGDYYGPCGNVTNNTPNALITVSSKVLLNTMTIIYERHAGAGSFRYRVNGGAWTTISTASTTEDIGNVVVNVSDAGDNIDLEIEPLAAGEVFCGVAGHRDGDGEILTMHKVGSSGTTADYFAHNPLWQESIKLLEPKGAIIMFGTNEMDKNVEPAAMRVNIQHIIDQLKQAQPNCDIMIMCPPETLYETEQPRKYKIANYADMLFRLALANHAAFIDFAKVFPHFSQASIDADIMSTDRKHPGDAGSELMAETIFKALKK
jgi:lysophospholipase L1-like esterase